MLTPFNPLSLPGLYFYLDALVNKLLWLGPEILSFIRFLAWLGDSRCLVLDICAEVGNIDFLYAQWKEMGVLRCIVHLMYLKRQHHKAYTTPE